MWNGDNNLKDLLLRSISEFITVFHFMSNSWGKKLSKFKKYLKINLIKHTKKEDKIIYKMFKTLKILTKLK